MIVLHVVVTYAALLSSRGNALDFEGCRYYRSFQILCLFKELGNVEFSSAIAGTAKYIYQLDPKGAVALEVAI